MTDFKRECEYEFISKLSISIEVFTSQLEKNNSSVFIYRGANLKYAFERMLYFIFCSDSHLYNIFFQWKTKQLPSNIQVFSKLQQELVVILCDSQVHPQLIFTQQKYFFVLKYFLKIPVKLLLNVFNSLMIFFSPLSPRIKPKRNLILFYINSGKFIRYLKPLLGGLKDNYVFYTGDKNTELMLNREDIPYLKSVSFFYNIKIFPKRDDYLNYYGLIDLYDHFYKIISYLRPKRVVIIEGNAPDHEIINQVCQKLNIPTICCQQGWSPIIHNGFRNMSYNKMLVWGHGFSKLLQPFNLSQKFIGTGSHVIKIRKMKRGNQIKRKAIGFFFQPPSPLAKEKNVEQMFDLMKWTACQFPDYSIIIREHPGYSFDDNIREQVRSFSNICFMPFNEYKLEEVLDLSYLAVAIYSTTILESIAAGVLPLIFNITSMPRYFPDVDKEEAGVEVETLQQAKIKIKKLVQDKKYYSSFKLGMEKFRKQYFAAGGEQAIKNIIRELSDG